MRVAFSPEGSHVATASLDRSARVWDVRTGTSLFTLIHHGEVIDVAYSPDGQWVATASRDRTAMIWDAQTGKPHCKSLFHDQAVRNVVFSPDGKRLLTRDIHALRLWDVSTGIPLTALLPHPAMGSTGFQTTSGIARFMPDGESVFIAADCRDALLWHIPVLPSNPPRWFPEFLEAVAGQRFVGGEEHVESVSSAEFLEMKRQRLRSPQSDPYSVWAREWLGR